MLGHFFSTPSGWYSSLAIRCGVPIAVPGGHFAGRLWNIAGRGCTPACRLGFTRVQHAYFCVYCYELRLYAEALKACAARGEDMVGQELMWRRKKSIRSAADIRDFFVVVFFIDSSR